MHGELIQSHLCLLAKERGPRAAERARTMTLGVLAVRGFVLRGRKRARARAALRRLQAPGAHGALESFSRSAS